MKKLQAEGLKNICFAKKTQARPWTKSPRQSLLKQRFDDQADIESKEA